MNGWIYGLPDGKSKLTSGLERGQSMPIFLAKFENIQHKIGETSSITSIYHLSPDYSTPFVLLKQ